MIHTAINTPPPNIKISTKALWTMIDLSSKNDKFNLMMYAYGLKTPSAVCAQIPIRKWSNITKGIKLIVFVLNAASAGILTEYLSMIYFLQKNEIIKYTVVIGMRIGIKDEYIIEIKKFKQIIAFYVAKSN